jgi:predicted nucleic acid-binding protein
LDTSVLSAFAPGKTVGSEALLNWIVQQSAAQMLFVPFIAVAEIEKGICKLRRAGGTARATRLSQWLNGLIENFGDQILGVDALVAREAGAIEDAAVAKGRNPGLADVLIAATAKAHALTVLTANEKHFKRLNVPCLNPFVDLPSEQ